MNRILLFGAGGYYQDNKAELNGLINTEIIGFIDNDREKQGKQLDGTVIYSIESLAQLEYTYIIIMSTYAYEIEMQLINYGIEKSRIKRLKEYVGLCRRNQVEKYIVDTSCSQTGRTVALITASLTIDGGNIAAKYLCIALKQLCYKVAVVAPSGKKDIIRELNDAGINVIIFPNIEFEEYSVLEYLHEYEKVIVNTYQMYHCIYQLSRHKKIYWWLHESKDMYDHDKAIWGTPGKDIFDAAEIFAVSKKARETFNSFFPQQHIKILEYGIPDIYEPEKCRDKSIKKIAVVGNVCEIKGQDLLLDAIDFLGVDGDRVEFYIIGRLYDTEYCNRLIHNAKKYKNVKIMNEMRHEELEAFYKEVDAIVVPSRKDSLPIVVTEGLMLKKKLIISDAVGTLEYLDKNVALIFQSENAEDLAEKILLCLHEKDQINLDKGRETYEQVFSMKALENRIVRML